MEAAQLYAAPRTKTVTEVIEAEHTFTISGYNLIKGNGSCDPVSSARFVAGGHEWVVLVYPEGKTDAIGIGPSANLHYTPPEDRIEVPAPLGAAPGAARRPLAPAALVPPPRNHPAPPAAAAAPAAAAPAVVGAAAAALAAALPAAPQPQQQQQQQQQPQPAPQPEQQPARAAQRVYVGVFAALVGEAGTRQGVIVSGEGPIVRVFHHFTLVNQVKPGKDLSRGRAREQGAISMGAAYADPASRNVHGYRKFVEQEVLEDEEAGFLKDDCFVIKYKLEIVVTRGGGLSRGNADPSRPGDTLVPPPKVPPCRLKAQMYELMCMREEKPQKGQQDTRRKTFALFPNSRDNGTYVHPFILLLRSPVLAKLMTTPGSSEVTHNQHVLTVEGMTHLEMMHMVFFLYTGQLFGDDEGEQELDPALLPHLLEVGDVYQVEGLKAVCEARLANGVTLDNALAQLELARKCHAQELARVCLQLMANNLPTFVGTPAYTALMAAQPELETQLLEALAAAPTPGCGRVSNNGGPDNGDRRPWPLLGAVFDRVGRPGPEPDGAVNGRRVRGCGGTPPQPAA